MSLTARTALALLLLLLTSCGGTLVAGIEGSGHASTATASGPISGFGSIFVNGVEYSTAGAHIQVDDQPATESQLYVGDIVTVTGTLNADGKTGTATQVNFGGNVEGSVDSVDAAHQTLTVLGQTVLISAGTIFDPGIQPTDITGIAKNARVEVSGYANSLGQIVASRIQLAPTGDALRVQGVVRGLDAAALTFQVNSLVVDYSGATLTGTLGNGRTVAVQGTKLTGNSELDATAVQVVPALGGEADSEGDIAGVITAFTSNAAFTVQSVQVTTNASTRFQLNGVTLGVNVRVEVEGSFDASGDLVATSVVATPEGAGLVRGTVASLPTPTSVMVDGVTVVTSAATELEDNSSQMLRPFTFSDLNVGDYIEARGTMGSGATLDATLLIREPPAALAYLQGTAASVNSPTLTILGIAVTTTAATQFGIADGGALTAAQFFAQAPNATVKVAGTFASGSFTATQAQIIPVDE